MAGFCPAIVDRELWIAVHAVREERRRRLTAQQQGREEEKLISPLAPGLSLNYLLSGLVRCGMCGASMRPSLSGRESKDGKRYVYYVCPRYIDGNCENGRYVPEEWLRGVVVDKISERLFPIG